MVLLCAGCAHLTPERAITTTLATAGGGAAGAAVGGAVTGGNPLGFAAGSAIGAAGGYVGAEIANSVYEGQIDKAKEKGRVEGQMQATKDFYRTLQAMQEGTTQEAYGEISNLEVTVPGGVNADGIRLVPDRVNIPVVQ